MTEQRYEKTFATGDRAELSLTNVRGTVRVSGWDRPEVSVVAVKRVGNYMGAQQSYDDTYVFMDQDGSSVRLRTRTTRGFNPFAWMGLGATPPEVDYDVHVPRQGQIAVRCVSGPVEIRDVSGSVYARTVSGDIYLERLGGSIIVHGVNGRVSAQEVTGNLGARTIDGSIGIRKSGLTELSARTVSGSVTLESPLAADGSYSIHTVSGDLYLHLPADARASLRLDSTSGRIQCDLPCRFSEQRMGRWQATLNGGGAPVEMHSVSGSMLVAPAGPDTQEAARPAAAEPAQPAPVTAEPEKAAAPETAAEPVVEAASRETPELSVLRAVERGEMTVDEALKKLEDLMGQ